MQQNATKRNSFFKRTDALTIEQENAINQLLTGASDQAVAGRLKLNRSTIHRWRHGHPLFIAELNRRRAAARDSSLDLIRYLVPRALETVRDQVVNGDGKLALAFLHQTGIFGSRDTGSVVLADVGPTDWLGVLDMEVRRRRADGRLPMPAPALNPPVVPTSGSASDATSTARTAGGDPAPIVEPPITDAERELVAAQLLEEAEDLPSDPRQESANGAGVVTTAGMSSFR
jgi:hypothetical protein